MAVLTEVGAVDMLGVLAGGGGAVVAGHTIAADTGMVEDRRCPGIGGVAVLTGITAGNVIGGFAECGGAVMTGRAVTADARMVEERR